MLLFAQDDLSLVRYKNMRIAVFDYKIIPTNPIGSCHRRMLMGLSREHEFVVFAVQFDNPDPQRIRFVRVPVPTRPLALLFVAYHLLAPIVYLIYKFRTGQRFDLVQTVESNCALRADIVYAHFCHRRFLKVHWPSVKTGGLRGFLRWLDHFLHSLVEPGVYRRAARIIVPSHGLRRELALEYPECERKICVLANPVDLDRMRRPEDFDRQAVRSASGFAPDDTVLVFVALGHFERKGLPLVLDAMASRLPANVKLNVVGGESGLIEAYRKKVSDMGLAQRVNFAGMQKDVRPHFWAADAFVLPSVYEVFPLVALEAAAAGIPMIVSPLNGVEEFLRDGANGFLIERSSSGVADGVNRLLALSQAQRDALGARAQQDVRQYSIPAFQEKWREVFSGRACGALRAPPPASGSAKQLA
jgi:glycosyltransferase involved in cell wall biosynthesis